MTTDPSSLPAIDRLANVVAAYGAEPGRWPAEKRSGFLGLIATSAAARNLLAAARPLDAALAMLDAPKPSNSLAARLARRPLPPTIPVASGSAPLRKLFAAAAAVAFLAVGAYVVAPYFQEVTSQSAAVGDADTRLFKLFELTAVDLATSDGITDANEDDDESDDLIALAEVLPLE